MQNVDQASRFPASFSQFPSELNSHSGYPYGAYPVDSFRQHTPPLDRSELFQVPARPWQQHGLPSPPSSPEPYAHFSRQPQQFNTSNSWGPSYLPGDRLQFQKVLGSGAYGVVHLAQDASTGIPYAVKALNKFMPNGSPLDQRQQQFQQTEMRLHYQVSDHPNIVSLLRIKDSPEHTYVIMDYCPEGDLFSNITEKGRYVGNDAAAKDVFLQILDAVAYCHSRGVYHRDLKPENILVTQGGAQVKLADFGLATTEAYATEFGCGSTFYMSPECQDQSSGMQYYACAPNDIWSLGVILVNLTCGRNPWKSASPKDSTFRAYMEDPEFLKSILPLSDELNTILGMIFELDPTRRIKLDELRRCIINCTQFTKSAQVDTPIYDDFEPLSPTSTISDEESVTSEDSDASAVTSVESEVDSDSDREDDVDCQVLDEDSFDADFTDAAPESKVAELSLPDWNAPVFVTQGHAEVPQQTYVAPSIVDSSVYQVPQGTYRIPSHVSKGSGKPTVIRDHRPAYTARSSPPNSRAPSNYRTQQHWSRMNPWQSVLDHSIGASRLVTF